MIFLSPAHHPFIQVSIQLDTKEQKLDCLIDTGFSGGISLPDTLLPFVQKPARFTQGFELADGSMVEYPVYRVSAVYRNRKKEVSAVFTKGDDALVGIEFLEGFRFILDLKKYTVTLS